MTGPTQQIKSDIQSDKPGVTNGDSHDHSGGDGAQIDYTTLSNPPVAETNANDIFHVTSPGGASAFVGTIATLPGGATLTYNVTSGQEGAMVPTSTSQLAKMRLYNTTPGRTPYALISNCVIGTNTLTLTANVPANWQVGDTITIASQTVIGTFSWVDLEITSGPTGKTALFVKTQINSAVAGDAIRLHPLETYGAGKLSGNADVVAAGTTTNGFGLVKMTNNVFSLAWTGTPTVVFVREAGYLS